MNDYKLMPGTPCDASEEETVRSIRAILTEDNPIEDPEPNLLHRAFAERTPRDVQAPRRRSTDLPELEPQEQVEDRPAKAPAWMPPVGAVKGRHLAYLAAVAVAVLAPQVFAGLVIGAPFVALALFIALGPNTLGQRHLARIAEIETNDPARGQRMRQRMDRFACLWDMVLDRLPADVADRLALPDAGSSRDASGAWRDHAARAAQ